MPRKTATRREGGDRLMMHRLISAAACLAAGAVTLPAPAGAQPIELHPSGANTGPSEMGPPVARSRISSAVPMPLAPADASAATFLEAARRALASGRPGEAQSALERAETHLLQRSAGLPEANPPAGERALREIGLARRALASRDDQGALHAIDDALAAFASAAGAASAPSPGPPVAPLPPPAEPLFTYALQAGHWQLLPSADYVWVPPEKVPRPVPYRPLIESHYAFVWRDGRWVWVPAHFGGD